MLRNYLIIAGRTLRRNAPYAAINIAGLTLGVACCVLLALFVHNEWTYDRFHANADRIMRVNRIAPTPSGDRVTQASTPAPLAPALASSVPEVERTVRLASRSMRIERGPQPFDDAEVLFADSTFFDVFTFDRVQGAPQQALQRPNTAVLSRTAAQTYFGTDDPIGQRLTVHIEEKSVDVTVAGVVDVPTARSSVQFDAVVPFPLFRYEFSSQLRPMLDRWDAPFVTTFALLRQADQRARLAEKLPAFAAQRFGDTAPGTTNGDVKIYGEDTGSSQVGLALQPLTNIHHAPSISSATLAPPSNPVYVYLLAGAALLVLLIAGINFTTLSLGQSARRAQEVGVRKALGAHRGQVRRQFWGEALLTSGIALVLGIGLAALAVPMFNDIVGTALSFRLTPMVGLGLVGLAVFVGLLAGSYPALVLSRFQPASILRGATSIGGGSQLVRSLVVVQFALSTALVVGTLVMSEQLAYMQRDLGFQTEAVVRITGLGSTAQGKSVYQAFQDEARRHPGVQRMATSTFGFFDSGGIEVPIALGDTAQITSDVVPVDTSFLDVLNIPLMEGRGFRPDRSDVRSVVVNRAFVREMGWTEALGKTIDLTGGSMFGRALGTVTVIGVTDDVHTQSMRQRIQPVMFTSNTVFGGGVGAMYARLHPDRVGTTLAALRSTWETVAPNRPFQYNFLDEVVAQVYQAEQRWRSIVQYAAGLALLIACFGLFGLAALAVSQRKKEVGIRKVLGASMTSLMALFSVDFLKLTALAFVVALPVAYGGAHQWLQQFAYRIDLGVGLFVTAGTIVLTIALLTVSTQALRAARLDPVHNLRDE